ncbi:MAG TPA: hypothetical protein VGN38_00540 [Caulobacteraceae bacterium]|jgi:hypothetical protein|nr:hypothetical protein [Caulobacteraceae bacterium]
MGVWTHLLGRRPGAPGDDPGHISHDTARQTLAREEAAFRRYGHLARGITEYVWVCPAPGRCDIARRNHGRRFSYLNPPPEGHPGEGDCRASDHCRCAARPLAPQMRRFGAAFPA